MAAAIQHRPVACAASSSSGLSARRCGLLPARPLQPQQPLLQQQRLAQQHRPRPAARPCRLGVAASAAAFAAASFDGGAAAAGGGAEPARDYRNIPRFPAFLAAARAVAFYITTVVFATPRFGCMLLAYPYVMKFDKWR